MKAGGTFASATSSSSSEDIHAKRQASSAGITDKEGDEESGVVEELLTYYSALLEAFVSRYDSIHQQ